MTPCVYCQRVVSGVEEGAQRLAVCLRRVLPIGPDRIPAVAQPFLIGVAVLRDDRGDALGMLYREPESGRRAIVEDIDRKAIEADHLGEAVDDAGDVVERVGEFVARRHVRLAEAGQIGRDDVEAIREQRDQITEHVAGARKAMQQQQLRRIRRPGLAIEDLEAVHIGGPVFDGSHWPTPWLNREISFRMTLRRLRYFDVTCQRPLKRLSTEHVHRWVMDGPHRPEQEL